MLINSDLAWTLVSFILTLLVFSYLIGDNPFFRIVSALFVGVTAGYFAVIILYQVILARLVAPLIQGSYLAVIPVLLSGMLLMKLSPRLASIGNVPMALLVGVGAAVAIGGAVLGTLLGQTKAAIDFVTPWTDINKPPGISVIEGVLFLTGTLATLFYFHFRVKAGQGSEPKRPALVIIFSWIGQFFIAITLGAVFAGVLTAAVTALTERADFILQTITGWMR